MALNGNIGLLTYAIAALSYVLLGFLLVAQWRVRPLGPALVMATTATALWATIVAAGTLYRYPPILLIQVSELARNAGWLFFMLQLLGFQESGNVWVWLQRRWLTLFLAGIGVSLGILALRPLGDTLGLSPADISDYALMLWLAVAITGLLLVEQIYRNASAGERWGVKFLCLGLGIMFAFDFLMYAEALLFRQLDAQLWQARGLVATLSVPWLIVAIARNSNWRMDVHVSRHVVFHTVTLMAAGAYLLAMAIIGYFIKYLGGNWGGVLQVSFLAGSSALLVTLLFSGTLRARLRVWLSKHFFSYRYDYRVEWLRFTEELAALENVPGGIIRTMATITQSPGGILLHQNDGGQLNELATWELDRPNVRESGNLQHWITDSGWVIDLLEWRRKPDLYTDLQLPPWIADHDKLWLIVPLFFQGTLEGLLMLARTDLKDSVNWEDRDLLKTAGKQAAALLAQQRASHALIEARQFDAFNRLSAYVIHDLKNILAQQSLMVSNAQKHRHNPAFVDDMIGTVENSVNRMQRLMDQMRSGMRTAEPGLVDLGDLLEKTIRQRASLLPHPTLDVAEVVAVVADRERLTTVFGHLIQNAQEATDDTGVIMVTVTVTGGAARVSIQDSGVGMTPEFVQQKLFKPFESTKGLTGMGIGAFESREYVRQLGGDITVSSTPGQGTQFTVSLPVADESLLSDHNDESCEPGTASVTGSVAH
ncbi:XrtA/PEP-CTERM system histidine kinase PrsK [Congregibacter litoralis]|uniref:histidine kinase n=1 Tax=Congregibacter litoralis KT71 TaxID=314285 RepID=A4A530_9GAMM|nr:putative PEP-CTERM system histidine kinase [Congregibacter litoralis KT71]